MDDYTFDFTSGRRVAVTTLDDGTGKVQFGLVGVEAFEATDIVLPNETSAEFAHRVIGDLFYDDREELDFPELSEFLDAHGEALLDDIFDWMDQQDQLDELDDDE